MVPGARLELASLAARDFKSLVYTNSTTQASRMRSIDPREGLSRGRQ